MPQYIALIGLPGSGKSTWIAELFKTTSERFTIISSDYWIEQYAKANNLSYDDAHAACEMSSIIQKLRGKINSSVRKEWSMIDDRTNLIASDRRKNLDMLPAAYTKVAVVFDIPVEVIIARQRSPERVLAGKTIPPKIFEAMQKNYVAPTLDEFDQIITVPYLP